MAQGPRRRYNLTVISTADKADRLGRKADDSELLDHAVRVGLVAYGVVHLLVAWLAISLALGDSEGSASGGGAFSEIAATPAGRISLYVVAAGFVALIVWQVVEAAVGHRSRDGWSRVFMRAVSTGRAVIYGVLAFGSIKATTGSGGGGGTDSKTAGLMSQPGGQLMVALVGVVILVVAGALVHRGASGNFKEYMKREGHTGDTGTVFVLLGKVGYVSKGIAMAAVGGLFLWAAATHDPEKSGGLDEALRTVLQQPFGGPMLLAIAIGVGCFGLFCFAWARHLDR